MATSAAPQPTPDEAADIASADEERSIALGNLSAAEGQLASDRADFDPTGIEGTQGPQPTFNEPTPQDHMQDIMKVAPLWMALGAIGGKFFKQSGLTMLSSTNAMMKGLVQGNADAYGQAREKYEQDYANFRDKQKTWMDTYKAYIQAYKGRIDADLRAVAGANTAVGIADKDLRAAHADVFKADQIAQQADRLTGLLLHWQNQDAQNAIRTEALRHKVAQEAGVAPDSQEAELLAALSEKGVSLPQGLRNKEVLKSTLSALIAKHPDETMDQIAASIKSGQIDMRTTQAEASKLGQREAAILSTEKSIVRPGGFLDQAEKAIQDVDLLKLKKAGSIEQWGREQLSDPKMAAYKARVTELRPLGEFAVWRAARAVGDHDLNGFLVRADPIAETEGLEPGMTVWLDRPNGVDGMKP